MENAQSLIVHITQNEHLSVDHFDTLYILLSNLSKNNIISLVNENHLLLVFSHINWNESEYQNIGLSLAKLILTSLSWTDIYNLPETDIILLLDYRNIICSLFLNQVKYCLSNEGDTIDPLTIPENMIRSIFKLVSNKNLEISANASNVIKSIAQLKPNGSEILFGNHERLLDIKSSFVSADSKLRLYEIAIQVAKHDAATFEIVSNSGLYDELVNCALVSDDILVQINALELMKDFIELKSGFQFLEDKKIIDTLDNKMNSLFEQPFGEMLFPGYITLFGRIAHHYPREVLSNKTRFKEFLSKSLTIFAGLTYNRLVVLETYAHIASTVEGKIALNEFVGASFMGSIMSHLGEYLTQSPNELRGRALDAVRNLLELPECDIDVSVCAITEHWFSQINGSSLETMKTIMSFVRQPFLEIRISALRILKVMVKQKWGLELCLNYGGFTEYILNRNTEYEKECKEEKYSIISNMVINPFASQLFDGPTLLNYKQYVKEGPLFIRPQAEVDIGGD